MLSLHKGFTLLEVCLALLIGLMLMLLAVPSVAGLLAEQRLQRSYERFDELVAAARLRSNSEQRSYALVWERDGIILISDDSKGQSPGEQSHVQLPFEKGETYGLRRPVALTANPPPSWIFWPNGTCEPAVISYRGKAGSWEVSYDPLTARGRFQKSSVP